MHWISYAKLCPPKTRQIEAKMSIPSVTADVIRFFCPDSEKTNLYVTGIPATLSEEEVHAKLDKIFSAFGLIYETQVFSGGNIVTGPTDSHNPVPSSYYAFVKLYSSGDASRARVALNKKYMIQGNLLKVSFARRKIQDSYPLSHSKCCHLANHYLGYNGWSSRIDQTRDPDNLEKPRLVDQQFYYPLSFSKSCHLGTHFLGYGGQVYEDKDHGDPSMVRFLCATKLEIPKHGITCDGIGLADEVFTVDDFKSRLDAYKEARKVSFRRAMENAFQQIAIVALSNGKVAVELCPEKPDEMVFMDDQIREELIEVNNMDEEVPAGDDDKENVEEGSQLDAVNEELLMDLLVDA